MAFSPPHASRGLARPLSMGAIAAALLGVLVLAGAVTLIVGALLIGLESPSFELGNALGLAAGLVAICGLAGVALVLVGTAVVLRQRFAARDAAALERLPALVVAERFDPRPGPGERGGGAVRVLTLEDLRGRRREARTRGLVADQARPGEVGVAYLVGGRLLSFQRAPGG